MKLKLKLTLILSVMCAIGHGQTPGQVALQGNFSHEDSVHVVQSFVLAQEGVKQMYSAMLSVWDVTPQAGKSKMELRAERWRSNETFMKWLGEPGHMKVAVRKIRKIHRKFDKKFTLDIVKDDEGHCNRWKGAWAVPYGPVKIRLCRNYLNMRDDLSAKFLIHEVGHEAGMLFHRDVFNCRDVLLAAATQTHQAKRSPETYAWLAMSYLGLDCNSRWRY